MKISVCDKNDNSLGDLWPWRGREVTFCGCALGLCPSGKDLRIYAGTRHTDRGVQSSGGPSKLGYRTKPRISAVNSAPALRLGRPVLSAPGLCFLPVTSYLHAWAFFLFFTYKVRKMMFLPS